MTLALTRRGKFLRYRADRAAVAYVVAVFLMHLVVWWLASPWVAVMAVIPLFLLSIGVAPLNHHHQHLNTFYSKPLNRVYELLLALQTGAGPYTWVLHHNLGHHENYLNQHPHASPDESHWTRADGSRMGRLEYTFHLFFHHPVDVYRVGRKYPHIYRKYWLSRIPLYSLVGIGLAIDPVNFALAFVVPGALTLLHTCWATYEHHAGRHGSDHFDASLNRDNRLYNLLSWNLGYHTAHHARPGIHWSSLPKYHATIRHRIPPEQIATTFW